MRRNQRIMRKLITVFVLSIFIISCENSKRNDISEENDQTFSNYKELALFREYKKVSDTSYIRTGTEPSHRITQLKRNDETIILFNKIIRNKENQEVLSILDTLKINHLPEAYYITIGYCEKENFLPEEIIAIVEKTENDTIQNIKKAWRANSETGIIEEISSLDNIDCLKEI